MQQQRQQMQGVEGMMQLQAYRQWHLLLASRLAGVAALRCRQLPRRRLRT